MNEGNLKMESMDHAELKERVYDNEKAFDLISTSLQDAKKELDEAVAAGDTQKIERMHEILEDTERELNKISLQLSSLMSEVANRELNDEKNETTEEFAK